MIRGHKPNGYGVTTDSDGRRIEVETRQCVHCQFMWAYAPGSGTKRGWCLKCNGYLCARAECLKQQEDLKKLYPGKMCMPYEEHANRLLDKADKMENYANKLGKDFMLDEFGAILVPKEIKKQPESLGSTLIILP